LATIKKDYNQNLGVDPPDFLAVDEDNNSILAIDPLKLSQWDRTSL
jgi:hypothetical protein